MAKPPRKQFGKWDFIAQFLMDPCDAPWSAYALAMGGATIESFVLLYSFDPSNFFYSALQSGTGISRRRSGRKGFKGTKANRFPKRGPIGKAASYDPSEALGRQLGRVSPLAKRPLPGVLGGLWLIFGVLEFANFWLFMVDVVQQWLWRWMSLLWNSQYCQARDDAVLLAESEPYIHGAIFGELPIIANIILKLRGPISYLNSAIVIPPGWSGVLTVGMSMVPLSPHLHQVLTVRLRKVGDIGPIQQLAYTLDPSSDEAAGLAFEINSGGIYIPTIELNQGFADLINTTLYVHIQEPRKSPVA